MDRKALASIALAFVACGSPRPPPPPSTPAPEPAARPPASMASVAPTPAPPPAAASSSLDLSRYRRYTHWSAEPLDPDERARRAVAARTPVVQGLFAAAGVPFPPAELLFRAFKQERELEVWASATKGAAMTLVATYSACALSGGLGPKRREGDRQVPEGFYKIQYLWPNSAYHLELKVGYPNDLDRAISAKFPEGPGGEIMIHGACGSIGCLAMMDERIEELWTMTAAFQVGERRVHVHIYPARDIPALMRDEQYQEHHRFWENLQEGLDRFEKDHRLFETWADWHARYYFR